MVDSLWNFAPPKLKLITVSNGFVSFLLVTTEESLTTLLAATDFAYHMNMPLLVVRRVTMFTLESNYQLMSDAIVAPSE